jgi:hypothetical protein
MARKVSPGMITRSGSNPSVMNFHSQGVVRAKSHGPRGPGFTVEFLDVKGMNAFAAGIADGAMVIADASVQTVVLTVDTIKQKLRTYFDSVFNASAPHRNNHRRASNAMVQSAIYDDLAAKGQFTGLIYSKLGRGLGPQSFIDYLLAHIDGRTLRPQGDWLRIAEGEDRSICRRAAGSSRPGITRRRAPASIGARSRRSEQALSAAQGRNDRAHRIARRADEKRHAAAPPGRAAAAARRKRGDLRPQSRPGVEPAGRPGKANA